MKNANEIIVRAVTKLRLSFARPTPFFTDDEK